MQKVAIDYANTIIYKIECKDANVKELYVGHTTNFRQRKNEHKYSCNNENCKSYDLKLYEMMRSNGGWDNWVIVEVEKYPCNEARAPEFECYKQLNATLNMIRPFRTEEQKNTRQIDYYYAHREERIKYSRLYKERIHNLKNKYDNNI
jgi:hypothetical protein